MSTTEIEFPYGDGEILLLEVTYTVEGEDRPATWGYCGGEPAESAFAEVESVVVLNDEAEGGFAPGTRLELEEEDLLSLEDKIMADVRYAMLNDWEGL